MYIEEIEQDIINRLRIKSHSLNTLKMNISYASEEELVYALSALIQAKIVGIKLRDASDKQSEDRYYLS